MWNVYRDGQTFFCWLSNSSMFLLKLSFLKSAWACDFWYQRWWLTVNTGVMRKDWWGISMGTLRMILYFQMALFWILDINATRTERNIYNNFGQKCNHMICLYLCLIRFINFILHHMIINEDIQSLLFKLRICLKLSSWVFFRACKRKISFSLRQGINISQLHSPWLWANILRRGG